MKFVKENAIGISFVLIMVCVTCLGAWSNEKMDYNNELEQQEYLSANLY